MDWLTILVFVVMCAVWGAEYLLVAKALDYFPTMSLMLLPQLFSIPVLVLISALFNNNLHYSNKHSTSTHPCLRGLFKVLPVGDIPTQGILQLAVIAFIFHGVGDIGFAVAEKTISSSVVAAIYCLEPVCASLYAYFKKLKHGNLDQTEWFGLLLSVVGVMALIYPELTEASSSAHSETVLSSSPSTRTFLTVCFIFAAVVSTVAYGVGTAVSQNTLEVYEIHESKATLFSNFFGTIFLFIEIIIYDIVLGDGFGASFQGILNVPFVGWCYIMAYTISSSVICGMMFMWLLKRLGAKAALNTILVRLFALFFGVTLNGEWDGYSWWDAKVQIIGAFVSLFGLLCMLRREFEEEEVEPSPITSPEYFNSLEIPDVDNSMRSRYA